MLPCKRVSLLILFHKYILVGSNLENVIMCPMLLIPVAHFESFPII